MSRIFIPSEEYALRRKRASEMIAKLGLDVLIVNGSEADYADTRYFSGFWPLFERCGVAIAANGDSALMVGPESPIFAKDVGKIEKIFVLREYRESANPAYPELVPSTFNEVFKAIGVSSQKLKIGVAAWLNTNIVIYEGIKNAYPNAEIVNCDNIMVTLRSVKSDNEIACLREAARITKIATEEVVKALRPGVTELQMVGIAQKTIYEHGAEYEGLPMYVFSQKSTKHAISRPSYRVIEKGDIVQLNLSAKIDGYSPSIGMPVSMGKLVGVKKELVEFGLEMHMWTERQIKAGVVAGEIAQKFVEEFKKKGYDDYFLYGPCHGLGLIEVEAPWMETNSKYTLQKNMTFQIDTFVMGPDFGLRWEKPIAVDEKEVIILSPQFEKIEEVDV